MNKIAYIILLVCLATTHMAYADNGPKYIGDHNTAALQSIGSPKIPVLLVQFSDLKFTVAASDEQVNLFFDLFCNGQQYKGAGSYGSVRDYFTSQSDNLFQPEFVVIGPVTLKESYKYYGQNQGNSHDINIRQFYSQAITEALKLHEDWSMFDNNNDGIIDMTYFIYAGEGENGGGDANTIWPKETNSPMTIGNLQFTCYACCNELYMGECDGIGVMCHELSHALGLPDFYDTQYVAYGLDYWDLMDSGNYCLNSYHPCGYSAYERDFMGWRPLKTLERDTQCQLTLYPISEGGTGYKIINPENPDEYYIIENRQNTGWDTYIGRGSSTVKRHGMLVSHIDYVRSRWTSNTVNTNQSHQYYTLIPADGQLDSYMYVNSQEQYNLWSASASADPFPGLNNVTTLFSTHQPIYTNSGTMHQPITGITENPDGTITLTFCLFTDINGDGIADSQDINCIYNYLQTSDTIIPNTPHDLNSDGIIDTQDILKLYEYLQEH